MKSKQIHCALKKDSWHFKVEGTVSDNVIRQWQIFIR